MSRCRLVVSVVLATLLLSACSDSHPPTGAASSGFNPFASGGGSSAPRPTIRPAALSVGDCFDTDQFTPGVAIDPSGLHLVSCADPHQHEVYDIESSSSLGDAPFPGDEAMTAFAEDACLAAFQPALGVDYRLSSLDFAEIKPDSTSWKNGDRSVICALHDADFAELVGSRLGGTTTTTSSTTSLASESS